MENKNRRIGDKVIFGRFPQETPDGSDPISWTIIDIDATAGTLLLLADRILYAHSFDKNSNRYSDSEIRRWLNSDFYDKAFSEEEKAVISVSEVDNSLVSTLDEENEYICDNTLDRVFLLSAREVTDLLSAADRLRTPTAVALQNGAYSDEDNGCGFWRLRTPNNNVAKYARIVDSHGELTNDAIFSSDDGVIPAIAIRAI